MEIIWKISDDDVQRVRTFFLSCENHPFVKRREERNIRKEGLCMDKKTVWKVIVACLLTTQQRSGPNSPVTRFLTAEPFPLDYDKCVSSTNLESYSVKCFSSFGGIRFGSKIGKQISQNFEWFNSGGWEQFSIKTPVVYRKSSVEKEVELANFAADHLSGFGPKQARNLLQMLGLTQFEIPIDSRIIKWFNDFGFPIKLSANALADKNYYRFVLKGIQELCEKCGIYPCLLDAAIFSSFDPKWEGYEGVL